MTFMLKFSHRSHSWKKG